MCEEKYSPPPTLGIKKERVYMKRTLGIKKGLVAYMERTNTAFHCVFAQHNYDSAVGWANDLDSLYNRICCRPWSAESRTENFISIGHSVAEILNVKVREINNFGNNFLFIFFIFVKVQLPIWWLIIYA